MRYTFADYRKAADVVAERLGDFQPEVAMILGSGLGDMADLAENPIVIPYKEIPGFSVSTAPGHKGQLVFGTLAGKRVAVMQGRLHAYEGYTFEEVCFPLRVLRLLGCDTADRSPTPAGGVNFDFRVGDIMPDHRPHQVLYGFSPPGQESGRIRHPVPGRHPPLHPTACRRLARKAAKAQGMDLTGGRLYVLPRPVQYETPAEIRAARVLGADLVGMSTVPEVHRRGTTAGMEVLGFSPWCPMLRPEFWRAQPLPEQEVLDAAAAAKERFSQLICDCVEAM